MIDSIASRRLNPLIATAIRIMSSRPSRRIGRTYYNEPVLFEMVRRGLARWETPLQLAIVAAWRKEV
jgi:hypothetical protein